jgi:hypothetical protein
MELMEFCLDFAALWSNGINVFLPGLCSSLEQWNYWNFAWTLQLFGVMVLDHAEEEWTPCLLMPHTYAPTMLMHPAPPHAPWLARHWYSLLMPFSEKETM